MTKARDLAVFNAAGVLTSTSTLNPSNLDDTGTIPSALLAGVGGGKVLQVQSFSNNSRTVVSNGSFNGIGLEKTITLSSATSKVLVLVSAQFGADSNNQPVSYVGAKFKLFRNHSGISETEIFSTHYQHNRPENTGMDMIFQDTCSISYIDSPATTNELTYSVKAQNAPSSSSLEVIAGGSNEYDKTITLIEIAA